MNITELLDLWRIPPPARNKGGMVNTKNNNTNNQEVDRFVERNNDSYGEKLNIARFILNRLNCT